MVKLQLSKLICCLRSMLRSLKLMIIEIFKQVFITDGGKKHRHEQNPLFLLLIQLIIVCTSILLLSSAKLEQKERNERENSSVACLAQCDDDLHHDVSTRIFGWILNTFNKTSFWFCLLRFGGSSHSFICSLWMTMDANQMKRNEIKRIKKKRCKNLNF